MVIVEVKQQKGFSNVQYGRFSKSRGNKSMRNTTLTLGNEKGVELFLYNPHSHGPVLASYPKWEKTIEVMGKRGVALLYDTVEVSYRYILHTPMAWYTRSQTRTTRNTALFRLLRMLQWYNASAYKKGSHERICNVYKGVSSVVYFHIIIFAKHGMCWNFVGIR
jgi:hypothetical protein